MPSFTLSLRPSKPVAMGLGAVTAAVVALSAGLYFWQTSEMSQVEKEVQAKRDQAASGERTAKQLQTVQQEALLVDNKLQALEKNVSPSDYIPTLLQQLEDLARRNGLEIDSTRPTYEPAPPPPAKKEDREKAPPPQPYDKVRIDMDLRGSYKNVAYFVHNLTRFQKIIGVDSVLQSVQAIKPGTAPVLSAKIRMTGYVFRDGGLVNKEGHKPEIGSAKQFRSDQRQVLDSVK